MAVALASQVGGSVDAFYSFKIQSPNSRSGKTALCKEDQSLASSRKFITASLKHDGGAKWLDARMPLFAAKGKKVAHH